ncbi:hypothetical protein PPMP20_18875 [Paraburkholderia phymatum]|uniref:Uncharacterized protein n=1 Tax=Paraburkholderia phymatum (strain DSM 17167 / CIP 108236 / LMG 21445 / STM815) TaxID=391038 RepID=B2JU76_PARP8|nr:hypothetical protein [Paraburkholderia phymatum]ACC76129.1 hypothetical protein Bphy_7128 [Paraburkholderia phymatum STM815]
MSRIRTVKPELFSHEELYDAEKETGLPLRLAYIGLFTVADREGRFRYKPRTLKKDVLPYDEVDFERVLDALVTRGYLVRYTSATGEALAYIPTFTRHQHVNVKEPPSSLPSPDIEPEPESPASQGPPRDDDACGTRDDPRAHLGTGTGTGTGTGKGTKPKTDGDDKRTGTLDAAGVSVAIIGWERERKKAARGVSPSNPTVIDLAALGLSRDELRAAYDDAVASRLADDDPTPVNAGFVRTFVEKRRNPPKPTPRDDWRRSESGISRRASELGIAPRPGESFDALRERVSAAERRNGAHP